MANSISPIILQLLGEGSQGVQAQNALTANQAKEAGEQAQLTGAQAKTAQAGVPVAQAQAQMQQTGLAAEMKMWGQRHSIAKAVKGAQAPGQMNAPPQAQTPPDNSGDTDTGGW